VNVNSCVATSNTAYDATYSGTSMATPNAAGSATLLVQLYSREFSSQRMRSSMLKALLIHTADDVGRPGPDYQYGWGLLNVKAAADVILAHKASLAAPKMVDDSISNSSKTKNYTYVWDGSSPLKATLCWTDPAGTAQTAADSRAPNLKHNLDLKITAPDGITIYQPYTMPFVGTWTQASMTLNATKGKNNVDNVERVDVPAPTQTGTYTVTVSLDGTLATSTQAFSLIVTGASSAEANPPPTVSLTSPLNGAAFLPGQNVTLTATAADMATGGQPGSVSKVEFLYGTIVIPAVSTGTGKYSATWTPTSPGTYLLTARATDSEEAVTTSSQVEFSVLSGNGSPSINSFLPASGVAGAPVTITGSNFGGVTAVSFNGSSSTSYKVDSLTQITAIVPGAATSGKISVTNSFGTGTSATDFVVVPIVLSEDFSTITSGNNTTTSGSSTVWAGDTLFPGFVNAYQAGGAVRIGKDGASGSITSKTLDLSGGAFEVSFDVKGWTTLEGGITVTVPGQTAQTVTYASVISGSFETKVVRFSAGTVGATITLATTAKRAFLDNIKVIKVVGAPVISSSLTKAGTVGAAFSYQIAASGTPTFFGATGLPAGLSLNTGTGAITGAPTAAGTSNVTISATNASGTGSATLLIAVSPSGGGGSNLLSEDFASLTTGGDTAATGTGSPDATAITANLAPNFPTSVTAYKAGGKVKLGSTSAAGSITSKTLDLSANGGVFSVSFDVKGWTDVEGQIKVTVGSLAPQIVTYTATMSATLYETKTLNFTGGQANSTVKIETTAKRAFLDNVIVATSSSFSPPTVIASGALAAVNTTYGAASTTPTSFTVSGSNLKQGILIAAPTGYEISQTGGASDYDTTQTVAMGTTGTVTAKTIYVRLGAKTPFGTYSGSITCNSAESAGATVATVASSVAKKQLTITANNQTKPFGTVLTLGPGQKQFTVNINDLVVGEAIDTVTLVASGGAEAQDLVGLYTLTASDPVPGALNLFRPENYECTFVSGKLNVVAEATFPDWAGEGVEMTPELLMKYAIGGATSASSPGERPETKLEGTTLSLTAIIRKDATLTIIGQAVTDLGNYGNSGSITLVSGSAVGVSQDGVPAGCERQKFTMHAGSAGKGFIRISVTK